MATDGDFIEWLVKAGIRAVERIGRRNHAPRDVVEEASDILTDQLMRRFPCPDEWSRVHFPTSYLNQSARRALWRAFLRVRRRRRVQLTGGWSPEEVDRIFTPPEDLREKQCSPEEVFEKVQRALRSLTPGELKAIRLAQEGHPMRVVAGILETSIETVYALLCTARKKIRQIWRDSA